MNTFKTTSVIQAAYGEDAKYSVLKFQLENDTGNYLGLESAEDYSTLTLYTKTGEALSSVNLNHELPSILGVSDKYLYVDVNGELVWKAGTSSEETVPVKYIILTDETGTLSYDQYTALTSDRMNRIIINNKILKFVSSSSNAWNYTNAEPVTDDEGNTINYMYHLTFDTTKQYTYKVVDLEANAKVHIADTLVHIQDGERAKWNNKADITTELIQDQDYTMVVTKG